MFVGCIYLFMLCFFPHTLSGVIRLHQYDVFVCRRKDEIRESGGVRCICRLLGVIKDEAVQEYIVITLAFLATQNDLYVHDNFRVLDGN
jgi:hypothetical protein